MACRGKKTKVNQCLMCRATITYWNKTLRRQSISSNLISQKEDITVSKSWPLIYAGPSNLQISYTDDCIEYSEQIHREASLFFIIYSIGLWDAVLGRLQCCNALDFNLSIQGQCCYLICWSSWGRWRKICKIRKGNFATTPRVYLLKNVQMETFNPEWETRIALYKTHI